VFITAVVFLLLSCWLMPFIAKRSVLMQCNIYALNFTSNMNVVNVKQWSS